MYVKQCAINSPALVNGDAADFVEKTLHLEGEVNYMTWMKKSKHERIQERLLVISKYRVFSIKKKFGGGMKVRVALVPLSGVWPAPGAPCRRAC